MLASFHTYLAFTNFTSKDEGELPLNIFDMGFIANFCNFFGNEKFLFWYPTEIKSLSDGSFLPCNPRCNDKEIM